MALAIPLAKREDRGRGSWTDLDGASQILGKHKGHRGPAVPRGSGTLSALGPSAAPASCITELTPTSSVPVGKETPFCWGHSRRSLPAVLPALGVHGGACWGGGHTSHPRAWLSCQRAGQAPGAPAAVYFHFLVGNTSRSPLNLCGLGSKGQGSEVQSRNDFRTCRLRLGPGPCRLPCHPRPHTRRR